MKNEYQHEILNNPKLWGKQIAISLDDKIIEVAENIEEIRKKMNSYNMKYILYSVPKNPNAVQIKTFKVKSIKKHDWRPEYIVSFLINNGQKELKKMLIDSGADISVVNYNFGLLLGFTKGNEESILTAEGFGSTVNYLMRDHEIEIDGFKFINRFAWLQDPELDDMIIGREIVFDLFDIEFKQADEEIIFKKR